MGTVCPPTDIRTHQSEPDYADVLLLALVRVTNLCYPISRTL